MDSNMAVTIIGILVVQLAGNVGFMVNLAQRVARLETHIVHLLRVHNVSEKEIDADG